MYFHVLLIHNHHLIPNSAIRSSFLAKSRNNLTSLQKNPLVFFRQVNVNQKVSSVLKSYTMKDCTGNAGKSLYNLKTGSKSTIVKGSLTKG